MLALSVFIPYQRSVLQTPRDVLNYILYDLAARTDRESYEGYFRRLTDIHPAPCGVLSSECNVSSYSRSAELFHRGNLPKISEIML